MTLFMNHFKTFTLLTLFLALGSLVQSTAQAVVAPLFYDPATGNVTLDLTEADGGIIRGYTLSSNNAFLIDNYVTFMNTPLVDRVPYQIGEANAFGDIPAGVYTVGDILPSGLSKVDVANLLSLDGSEWLGGPGGFRSPFGLVYGPSPFPAVNNPSAPPPIFDWASEATLIYDPVTGNVKLDSSGPQGGNIASYILKSSPGSFHAANSSPASEGGYHEANDTMILEENLTGLTGGIYDLGQILSPGLDLNGLHSHLTSAKFLTAPGHGFGDFDIETNGVGFTLRIAAAAAPVPEPSTYAMAVIGLVGLLAYRRWR